MSNVYKNIVRDRIKDAIGKAQAVNELAHSGERGALREIVVRDVLRPLLPADLGVGAGTVIDRNGRQSRQQDVILYDQSILPPALFGGDAGVFPIESVLYTIEVKSTLDASGLQGAHESASDLAKFSYIPGHPVSGDSASDQLPEKAFSVIVAFGSDLTYTRGSDPERYDNMRGEAPASIRAICVLGRGYWIDKGGSWLKYNGDYPGAELTGMVSGIINTYRHVSLSRGSPPLGMYLLDDDGDC
jgi:hypothetical protein